MVVGLGHVLDRRRAYALGEGEYTDSHVSHCIVRSDDQTGLHRPSLHYKAYTHMSCLAQGAGLETDSVSSSAPRIILR